MKITTYPINAKMRRQLVKDGWISRPPMSFIYDRIILNDCLNEMVEALREDPNFDVSQALHTTFSRCRRYYLTDNFRRLFGLQRQSDNAFEMDITNLFLSTLEAQIRNLDTDIDHLVKELTAKIEKRGDYAAAQIKMGIWGYN